MAGVEVGTAYVTVLPSTQGFHKALAADVNAAATQAGTSGGQAAGKGFTSGFGKAAAGIGAAMAGVFTAGKVAQLAGEAITAGSDLAESQSKVAVVFGSSAKAINDWAATSSTSMLMSSQAALEAAGTYGNLFQAFGLGQQKSQEMSQTLVQLAADLASFNNTSVDDALLALRSGLSGETEPLKRYGVALTDARLKQEALTLGIFDGTGMMSAAVKAQASYALILKDTTLAQGDVKRTADGYANTVRAVTAEIDNQKAVVGTELVKAIQNASSAMGGPGGLVEMTKSAGDMAASAAAGIGVLTSAIVTLGGVLPEVIDGENALWTILKSFPAIQPTRWIITLGDSQRDSAAKAADMSYQNRLLNEALNQTPYATDPAATGIEAVGTAADVSRKAVDDLRTSLDKLSGKNDLRSSRLAIQDSWAALDTMGDTRQVKRKVRNPNWKPGSKAQQFITTTDTVQDAFDPATRGGRFAATESGRKGERWAVDIAQQYMERASLMSERTDLTSAQRLAAAQKVIDQGQAALAGQFSRWGIARPKAYADSFIAEPAWVKQSIRNNRTFQNGMIPPPVQGPMAGTGPGSINHIYQFTGDIVVPTVAEAARRATEVARLKAISHGQIPAAAS